MKQTARPIPYHLQSYVEKGKNKLIKSGHRDKKQNIEENAFVSPLVLTVKKDETVGIALGSRELNDNCRKMRPDMPRSDESLNQISTEKTRVQNEPFWIPKVNLE